MAKQILKMENEAKMNNPILERSIGNLKSIIKMLNG